MAPVVRRHAYMTVNSNGSCFAGDLNVHDLDVERLLVVPSIAGDLSVHDLDVAYVVVVTC